MTKFVALYLPQYHTIPENDLWWGKGFTEWIRVRNAEPLFEGHDQPRVPSDYYDLSDESVMIKQAKMAKEFGIHGFCYYHYWFNGTKLLEKPLENMLANENVDIPFCLSWANEKWTRAWEGKSKEILIDQEYGGEKEWKEHLEYLIPFFEDSRYIRISGNPVFLIYRTESFKEFDKMISFWNLILSGRGIDKLFVIEMLTNFQKEQLCENTQGVLEFEPMFTIGDSINIKSKVKSVIVKRLSKITGKYYKIFDYNKVWGKILNREKNYGSKITFPGAFTDWDNTPRFKGKSTLFRNVSPQKFGDYLIRLAKRCKSEFIFINAWNEWAEGAYLEPDKTNGTKFLEAVKKVNSSSF